VTHCRFAKSYEQYNVLELAAYKLLNVLTIFASRPPVESVDLPSLHGLPVAPGVVVFVTGTTEPPPPLQPTGPNIKNVMDPDKYAFWYEGKPWKGAPERGIKEGDLRDGGSLATRAANVAYWHQWPDEYDYLMKKWDEFLSA